MLSYLQVIPAAWLRLFSPREVNQLLGGGEAAALDIDDMQAHTVYRWGALCGLRLDCPAAGALDGLLSWPLGGLLCLRCTGP